MIYCALLRGINVGGNNKINMKELKAAFEKVGMTNVSTYINSGNIIFTNESHSPAELTVLLEDMIQKSFSLSIKVLLRNIDDFRTVLRALPDDWINDKSMRSNVMFLWEEIDSPGIMEKLKIREDVDNVSYIPGSILWNTPGDLVTKSGLMKLAGTALYKKMTVRNVNTARKLAKLMEDLESDI